MPYPNQHACRLRQPGEFQDGSMRTMERPGELPKGISLIIGKLKGKATTTTQAVRYNKDTWDADRASADCDDKGGSFEAAGSSAEAKAYPEASWQEVLAMEYQDTLEEAATVKAKLQALLRQADALLDLKVLPSDFRAPIKTMRQSITKPWAELSGEGDPKAGDSDAKADDTSDGDGDGNGDGTSAAAESYDMILGGDVVTLTEAGDTDMLPVKIIQPGWGSSGYYPANVLERDAGVYRAGTHMYWDHPTANEEKDRPERSLKDLAGILAEDGRWDALGPAGPGVYAKVVPFTRFRDSIRELAPYIGISHRAAGRAKRGEAEGRQGDIIESITKAHSVDYVTVAGAGGQVLQLFEAIRGNTTVPKSTEKEVAMTEKPESTEIVDGLNLQITALTEENARLKEGQIIVTAERMVAEALKEAAVPDITKARLLEVLKLRAPIKEGAIDKEAFADQITEAVKSEIAYLSSVTESGKITGMGGGGGEKPAGPTLKETFKTMYLRRGMVDPEAEHMAAIAAAGR